MNLPLPVQARRPLTSLDCIKITADLCALPERAIISEARRKDICQARFLAIWLARTLLWLTLPRIAKVFGDRDHTSILHAIRRAEDLIKTDPDFAAIAEHAKHKATTEFTV